MFLATVVDLELKFIRLNADKQREKKKQLGVRRNKKEIKRGESLNREITEQVRYCYV